MSVEIRKADLKDDRTALIDTLIRYLNSDLTARRYDWLYRECPHGQASAWLVYEDVGTAVVGCGAVFPRRMYVAGSLTTGCVLGDFCISSAYRTLGPAVQLQRACLSLVSDGTFSFAVDFPSRSMLAVYQRLRIRVGESVRMARPLRAWPIVQRAVKSRTLTRLLTPSADTVLHTVRRPLRMRRGVSVERVSQRFGQEFSELAAVAGERVGNCVVRDAEYLNWRFVDHPMRSYEKFAAFRDRELAAYCVSAIEMAQGIKRLVICDLFGELDSAVVETLLAAAIEAAGKQQPATLTVSVPADTRCESLFQSLGFAARETHPLVLVGGVADQPATWLLFDGDRES